jgi:hypothetical protein
MTDLGRKIESKLTNNRYPHFPFGNPPLPPSPLPPPPQKKKLSNPILEKTQNKKTK